ncbi:hypothetical protein L6452_29942 [Arctium lappa]|uniref:Uncharacterized protein n=1 Tax=Arctium lappa TaxID=4217 RepID=A0ACB8ZGN2_ARCLA|nr:hypothetical protein L6452_29942 [Arctium lappa]
MERADRSFLSSESQAASRKSWGKLINSYCLLDILRLLSNRHHHHRSPEGPPLRGSLLIEQLLQESLLLEHLPQGVLLLELFTDARKSAIDRSQLNDTTTFQLP